MCFKLKFMFSLEALSYTGHHMTVQVPALVEKEIKKDNGSVIKRFGLLMKCYCKQINSVTGVECSVCLQWY